MHTYADVREEIATAARTKTKQSGLARERFSRAAASFVARPLGLRIGVLYATRMGGHALILVLIVSLTGCAIERRATPSPKPVVILGDVARDAGEVLTTPPDPPYQPPRGTVGLAVIDEQGNVTTGHMGPPNITLANLVAPCHAPGRPSGHVAIAIEEDDTGRVNPKAVLSSDGLDATTIACVRDAIVKTGSLPTLSGTLSGALLPDGGWKVGSGICYVTLY